MLFYTLRASEHDFPGRCTVLWGCGLGEGLADASQLEERKVAGSCSNDTTRLPSDHQEVNTSDPLVRGLGEGLGEWLGLGMEDVASQTRTVAQGT